ncbi:chemotaxis protein CheW [Pseudomonas sp. HR96]|uniref:chemotaxis protein CheW n=1 Tax=Pseudomonas sp. HR96 TaxID=1027966 RepID=UPI002A75F582|nr:chemotaxis protein CheW [Pseudomonas sp. HR96]WPP00223.1 chemotaxis protein CheW [Pseudomonas sp. HR96]
MPASRTAFELLLGIDQRCRQRAASLPAQSTRLQSWSGIGFRLGQAWYVAPMAEVAEVLHPPHVTRLPGVKPWVLGMVNLRGQLLALMDLGACLGLDAEPELLAPRTQRRVLVVDRQDVYAGLLVDEVSGLQHFDLHGLDLALPASAHPALAPYLQGSFQRERNWQVFSPFALVQAAAFRDVAL